jgi:hypothetical protein
MTREGGIGILQIVGFTEDPKGVKIRYKMVQGGAQPKVETGEAPWGEAVHGMQVRLRPDKEAWQAGEVPTLKADVRNQAKRVLLVQNPDRLHRLEVDGVWFTYDMGLASLVVPLSVGAGSEQLGMPVALSRGWRAAEGQGPLALTPGKHTIRFALAARTPGPDEGEPLSAISNPVEIEILPARGQELGAQGEKRQRVEAIVQSLPGADREVSQRLMLLDDDALSALEQFRDAYRLAPGESFKLIPFASMAGRQTYYEQFQKFQAEAIPRGPDRMTFRWADSRLNPWGMSFGDATLVGLLTSVTGLRRQEIEDRGELLQRPVAGDAVFRGGIELAQLLPDIERALKEQANWPVKLTLRDVERTVVVASGAFRYTPLSRMKDVRAGGRPAVEIYGTQPRDDPATGAGGSGEFSKFLQWIGSYVGKPVVAKGVTAPPEELMWLEGPRLHGAGGRFLFPLPDDETALVLKHLSEQTGLAFAEAKRTVKILFVELDEPPG